MNKQNSLLVKYPEIAKEWHPSKNGDLTPADVSYGSNIVVWWQCSKGHEWQSSINNRNKGMGCRKCHREPRLLINRFPELIREWHTEKNNELGAYLQDITYGSSWRVWWICSKGHEWRDAVSVRTLKGKKCPICSKFERNKNEGKGISKLLIERHPEIVKEWHPTKNSTVDLNTITYGSDKNVWWICSKGHEWKRKVKSRTYYGSGCPYCGKK